MSFCAWFAEGKLQAAFQTEAERYTGMGPAAGLHYIAFDFHHECSKGRYDRIELLWNKASRARLQGRCRGARVPGLRERCSCAGGAIGHNAIKGRERGLPSSACGLSAALASPRVAGVH